MARSSAGCSSSHRTAVAMLVGSAPRAAGGRLPVATVEKVFALYREKYFDLNVQHFHEKLQAGHGIELSYTWVKQALQGAGLVARGRKRGAHRKRRERRPLPGMLLHIDGSRHPWFQDE